VGRRGFTLVELLVVIGISSFFLLFSFSSYRSFQAGLYLKAFAHLGASELRKVQGLAQSQGKTLSWSLDQLIPPKEVKISKNETFKFSSSGFPLPGGTGTAILRNSFGRDKKIVVSSVGRVRVE
jgi:prepilin-type N-terminal cleavage/methylation domain-containing protein